MNWSCKLCRYGGSSNAIILVPRIMNIWEMFHKTLQCKYTDTRAYVYKDVIRHSILIIKISDKPMLFFFIHVCFQILRQLLLLLSRITQFILLCLKSNFDRVNFEYVVLIWIPSTTSPLWHDVWTVTIVVFGLLINISEPKWARKILFEKNLIKDYFRNPRLRLENNV